MAIQTGLERGLGWNLESGQGYEASKVRVSPLSPPPPEENSLQLSKIF